MPWSVPRIWVDETCIILGGGPSLLDIDFRQLEKENVRFIAVNNAFKLMSTIDVLYFKDCIWYKWNKKEVDEFKGKIITTCSQYKDQENINFLATGKKGVYDNRPTHLGEGRNSGQEAISLATHFGVNKIILLGFDMKAKNGVHNWHNEHHRSVDTNIYQDQFIKGFNSLAEDLKKLNIKVINSTNFSDLNCFPKMNLQEALNA